MSQSRDYAAQDWPLKDHENPFSVWNEQLNLMMPSLPQQPIDESFAAWADPQTSRLPCQFHDTQDIQSILDTSNDIVIEGENTMPVNVEETDVTLLQPVSQSLIAAHTYPPTVHPIFPQQCLPSAMSPRDNRTQSPSHILKQHTRKRAPKAPTMSAKTWIPAEDRIRQLFIDEERSYNERQYKTKILQMKLKRNVESSKRSSLIRHIQYRKDVLGKPTNYVRVYSHRKSQAMVQQWMNEHSTKNFPIFGPPLTPLSSQISIHTRSVLASASSTTPAAMGRNILKKESASVKTAHDTPVKRHLGYAHELEMIIKSEQSRAIFNDFQTILSSGNDTVKCPRHDEWNPEFEEFLVAIRNWMNLTKEVRLGQEVQHPKTQTPSKTRNIDDRITLVEPEPHSKKEISLSRTFRHTGRWRTPYGVIAASFEQIRPSLGKTSAQEDFSTDRPAAAQIVIYPYGNHDHLYGIALDLNPQLNPSAKITYQAIRPNNWEVFQIVKYGKLEDLLRVLDAKTAHLMDRDEDDQSLLYVSLIYLEVTIANQEYAKCFSRVEFIKSLLQNGLDPNTSDCGISGGIWYLSFIFGINDWQYRSDRSTTPECVKVLLEEGLDPTLQNVNGIGDFELNLLQGSPAALKHLTRYGTPFLHP